MCVCVCVCVGACALGLDANTDPPAPHPPPRQAESSTAKSAADIITASRARPIVTATAAELLQSSAALLTQAEGAGDALTLADLDPQDLVMPEHVVYEDADMYYRVMENYMDPWTLPFKPTTDTPESQGARAGGFTPQCLYERSLKAAFTGIFAA